MSVGAGEGLASRSVGGWELLAVSDGVFRLDGGAMWGVVPANIWRELTPPADDNTIAMQLRSFVARRGDDVVLIEGGAGARWSDKLRRIYHLEECGRLESSMRSVGVEPESITHVVASHCHWDHIGALVKADGKLLCPNARHFAPAIEVERCLHPDHVRRGSYRPEDLQPIIDAGHLETWEGTAELLPDLTAHSLGGHSDGVSVITLGDPETDDCAIFWADVVPTTHHIQPPYIMAYDIDVERSFDRRSEWLARAAERGWTGLFYHDLDHGFARLSKPERRFVATPV